MSVLSLCCFTFERGLNGRWNSWTEEVQLRERMLNMIAYGPVPSRRLGRSLGINNIPPKFCSYACAYCQVGSTVTLATNRQEFYPLQRLVGEVATRIDEVRQAGESVEYLSFVPDGEPTLDINLGREIEELQKFGIPLAVITNSSLLDDAETRRDLGRANWVSLKVDTVDQGTWRRLNRPHALLRLPDILDGIRKFRESFSGTLVTETMLVAGVNDTPAHATDTANFLASLEPDRAYLTVPTRPPTAKWVHSPTAASLVQVHDVFSEYVGEVEYLMGYEGSAFSTAGDPRQNLLATTAVHPMRAEAVKELLDRTGTPWSLVEELLNQDLLLATDYGENRYYLRRPQNW